MQNKQKIRIVEENKYSKSKKETKNQQWSLLVWYTVIHPIRSCGKVILWCLC